VFVLPTLQDILQPGSETLQVTIDAGMAVGMGDIDSIAEAKEADGNPADVAIADAHNPLALNTLGAQVETAMEMVRTWLAKIARQ